MAVGSLWAINSWDYPTYVLLAILFIGAGVYLRPGKLLDRLGIFLVLAPGMVLLSVFAFLPFHMNFHPFPTGLDVSKWQSPIPHFLGIHGLFLFLLVTFLTCLWAERLQGRPSWGRIKGLLRSLPHHPSGFRGVLSPAPGAIGKVSWTIIAAVLSAAVVIYLAVAGYCTAALLTLLLAPTVWAAGRVIANKGESASYMLVPLVLVAFALLIAIGVEFVRVKDDIGRMNTLFKYYLEVWVLFAIVSPYIIWHLASRGILRLRKFPLAKGTWLGMLAILLVASFIYPILGTRARLADRWDTQNMTLDGADYMRTAVHSEERQPIEFRWDYAAILWLQDNVKGSPVVLEAQNDAHHWSSRISDYTGLPTLLGWSWHQTQQRMRYADAVRDRVSDVERIYSTRDVERALDLLRLYEVEYVVVGQLEKAYYPDYGLLKFDRMVRDGLAEVVYQNEGIKIYQALWYN